VALNFKEAKFGLGCILLACLLRLLFFGGLTHFRVSDLLTLTGGAVILLMAWGFSRLLR
jgi:hypothetical protein